MSAPPRTSCLSDRSLLLGARVRGDWTRALNKYVQEAAQLSVSVVPSEPTEAISEEVVEENRGKAEEIVVEPSLKKLESLSGESWKEAQVTEKSWTTAPGVPAQVMIDGPYGGSGIDIGEFERVLLVAGGSGVTFTLGLLDDIVGRCVKLGRRGGERTRSIEFAWCIRSYCKYQIQRLFHSHVDIVTSMHRMGRSTTHRTLAMRRELISQSPHLHLRHLHVQSRSRAAHP